MFKDSGKAMKKGPDLIMVLIMVFVVCMVITGVSQSEIPFSSLLGMAD